VVRILDPHDEARLVRELDQIRKALAVDATLGATDAVKEGRRVRITAGPFLGIEGIVTELKGAAKVVLNVEMIGRAVVVVTDRDCLEPAE
jgi:transcription antitermination factor NusG